MSASVMHRKEAGRRHAPPCHPQAWDPPGKHLTFVFTCMWTSLHSTSAAPTPCLSVRSHEHDPSCPRPVSLALCICECSFGMWGPVLGPRDSAGRKLTTHLQGLPPICDLQHVTMKGKMRESARNAPGRKCCILVDGLDLPGLK